MKIYTTVGSITMRGGTIQGADQAEIYGAGSVTFSGMMAFSKALRIRATNGFADLRGTITSGNLTLHGSITAYKDLELTTGPGYYSDATLTSITGSVIIHYHA